MLPARTAELLANNLHKNRRHEEVSLSVIRQRPSVSNIQNLCLPGRIFMTEGI